MTTEKNTTKQLYAQLVKDFTHLLEQRDLEPLVVKINEKRLEEKLGIAITADKYGDGTVYGTNLTVTLEALDIEPAEQEIIQRITVKGYNLRDISIHQKIGSLFNYYGFKHDTEEIFYASRTDYFQSTLIYVLDFVVNGNLEQDYARANEIVDTRKKEYEAGKKTVDFSLKLPPQFVAGGGAVKFPELNNISVKVFQNGRIDIKGLSPAQKQLLISLEKLCKGIHNTSFK